MAIKNFQAIDKSTIWDVVLNTYGSVDQIVKIMQDNSFPNVNTYPINGQQFQFDDTLVENQNNLQSNLSNSKFSTRDRTTTNDSMAVKYEQIHETDYTSNADGTTIISLPDEIGNRLVFIEKEIRPIELINWSWNQSSGILTLLNGTTIDNGQVLFMIFATLIQS
jgi:hypothetical protein